MFKRLSLSLRTLFSLTPSRSPSPYSIFVAQCSTSSPPHITYPHPHSHPDPRKVRVLVWWDLDNCDVPSGVNVFRGAQVITAAIESSGIKGPIHIKAFVDILRLARTNQEALSSTGDPAIDFTHIPHGDECITHSSLFLELMLWVKQNPPPVHLFLITVFGGYASFLRRLRMNDYNILLASKESAPADICRAATVMWNWDALVRGESLTGRYFNQPPNEFWYGHYEGPLEEIPAFDDQPPDDQPGEVPEVFSQDSFWIDVQTFINTDLGSLIIAESSTSATESDGGAAKTELDQSQTLEGISRNITTVLANAGCSLEGSEAELVLYPLRLVVQTKNLKILEPALDCLHKLIAYNHLEGDPGLDGGKNVPLFTDILNMVCNCVDNSSPDSSWEPFLGVIRICYNIALHSKSPINQATSKAMLTQMISIVFRRMETDPQSQVSISSGSNGNAEAASAEKLTAKVEETPAADQNEEGMSLGDALNQVKKTSFASVEELHNLAGGAAIKGLEAVLDKAVHTEDGKKITRGIDLESMNVAQRDALLVFRTLCKMGMKEDNDEVTTKTRILSLELLQHATGIFSVLLLSFRDSLKGEIGVFFPSASSTSSILNETSTSAFSEETGTH